MPDFNDIHINLRQTSDTLVLAEKKSATTNMTVSVTLEPGVRPKAQIYVLLDSSLRVKEVKEGKLSTFTIPHKSSFQGKGSELPVPVVPKLNDSRYTNLMLAELPADHLTTEEEDAGDIQATLEWVLTLEGDPDSIKNMSLIRGHLVQAWIVMEAGNKQASPKSLNIVPPPPSLKQVKLSGEITAKENIYYFRTLENTSLLLHIDAPHPSSIYIQAKNKNGSWRPLPPIQGSVASPDNVTKVGADKLLTGISLKAGTPEELEIRVRQTSDDDITDVLSAWSSPKTIKVNHYLAPPVIKQANTLFTGAANNRALQVKVELDTVPLPGVKSVQYSIDGGLAWQLLTLTSDQTGKKYAHILDKDKERDLTHGVLVRATDNIGNSTDSKIAKLSVSDIASVIYSPQFVRLNKATPVDIGIYFKVAEYRYPSFTVVIAHTPAEWIVITQSSNSSTWNDSIISWIHTDMMVADEKALKKSITDLRVKLKSDYIEDTDITVESNTLKSFYRPPVPEFDFASSSNSIVAHPGSVILEGLFTEKPLKDEQLGFEYSEKGKGQYNHVDSTHIAGNRSFTLKLPDQVFKDNVKMVIDVRAFYLAYKEDTYSQLKQATIHVDGALPVFDVVRTKLTASPQGLKIVGEVTGSLQTDNPLKSVDIDWAGDGSVHEITTLIPVNGKPGHYNFSLDTAFDKLRTVLLRPILHAYTTAGTYSSLPIILHDARNLISVSQKTAPQDVKQGGKATLTFTMTLRAGIRSFNVSGWFDDDATLFKPDTGGKVTVNNVPPTSRVSPSAVWLGAQGYSTNLFTARSLPAGEYDVTVTFDVSDTAKPGAKKLTVSFVDSEVVLSEVRSAFMAETPFSDISTLKVTAK
jgi:hypothetical protein